jgi:hypothetical protein
LNLGGHSPRSYFIQAKFPELAFVFWSAGAELK